MSGVFAHWPNRITALRFVGALVLFGVLAVYGETIETTHAVGSATGRFQLALWLFVAVGLSDVLDGWLARRGNVVTAFGRVADPFVDKVLVLGTMVFLAVMPWSRHLFPAWLVVVILSREFLVTGVRGYVESIGGSFPADNFGKAKMFLQCVAVSIALALPAFELETRLEDQGEVVCRWFIWATLITTVGSGLSYVFKARAIVRERQP
jgi:CDP-diacylglycerol--glycerol-3-phosphate 3-phosphatidyltransferase